MNFTFRSSLRTVGHLDALVDTGVIHDEPMLFSASWNFAMSAGGPLTRMFMRNADIEMAELCDYCRDTNQHCVIDSRSHMLMPGFRPAIGGWHCDAYPRQNGGQPDLEKGIGANFHLVCFVSDDALGVSRTEFLPDGSFIGIPDIDPKRVWHSVDECVNERRQVPVRQQVDGEILRFGQATLHRATPAVRPGWRWWIRASVYPNPPKNQIRKQVQVYGPENQSW